MIIKIAGTNGSGKTWVARAVMALYSNRTPWQEPGAKRPLGYTLTSPECTPLAVVGHYEVYSGGCDRISELDHSFRLAAEHADRGEHVLMEGLFVGKEVSRTVNLSQRFPALVIFLNTPAEECERRVNERRKELGKDGPVDPKKLRDVYRECQSAYGRLQDAGVRPVKLSGEEALARCRKEFGV